MKFSRSFFTFLFVFLLFILVFVQHRHHSSMKAEQKQHFHLVSRKRKASPPSPTSKSSNKRSSTAGTTSVFNLMLFGAKGDGISDDTRAVTKAWDAACRAKCSATLLVPRARSFMIRSTTFEGPCKNDLVFQVKYNVVRFYVAFELDFGLRNKTDASLDLGMKKGQWNHRGS